MGELTSTLFTQGDPAVVKKLEDCATGRPHEVLSHFKNGQRGEHIRRVQQALKNVRDLEPQLGIPPFEVTGSYDDAFAKAVAHYKDRRRILNHANKIDDIVGIKTIRSLDKDVKQRRQTPPAPLPAVKPNVFPRPIPNCVPDADVPPSQEFDIRLLAGASVGEVFEGALFFFTIRDTTNGLSCLYKFRGPGGGLGAIPVTPAVNGKTGHFRTDKPVRVTRFGPAAIMIGGTTPPSVSPIPVTGTVISLSFKAEGARGLPQTPFFAIDTGDISIPGGGIHGAQFLLLTVCSGGPGATRKILGLADVGPIEN
jgi:hypothetical protein